MIIKKCTYCSFKVYAILRNNTIKITNSGMKIFGLSIQKQNKRYCIYYDKFEVEGKDEMHNWKRQKSKDIT